MYLSSGAVMDGLVFGPWQAGRQAGVRADGGTRPLWGGFAGRLQVGRQRGSVVAAIIQHERGEEMIPTPAFLFLHRGSPQRGCCPVARDEMR